MLARFALVVVMSSVAAQVLAQAQALTGDARPIIKFDKTRFATTE